MGIILLPDPALPGGVTGAELDSIRAAQRQWLFQRVIQERPSLNEYDDGADQMMVLDNDVPARITAGYGSFRAVADRLQGVNYYTITFEYDRDVASDDRITDEVGNKYKIQVVRSPSSMQTAVLTLAESIT